jgi:hypothetical protein
MIRVCNLPNSSKAWGFGRPHHDDRGQVPQRLMLPTEPVVGHCMFLRGGDILGQAESQYVMLALQRFSLEVITIWFC